MVKTLISQIEAFKMMGVYSVTLNYGQGMGCDDMDTPTEERKIKLHGAPVGMLGEGRLIFAGTLGNLIKCDLESMPVKLLHNPPTSDEKMLLEKSEGAMFAFATDRSVATLKRDYNAE